MKKYIKIIISLFISFLITSSVFANEKIHISLNGQKIEAETEIIDGSVMAPVRSIFEPLGFQILWDEANQMISAIQKQNVITLKIGDKISFINNVPFELPVAPIIKNNSAMAPVRFMAENSGATVHWNETIKAVDILSNVDAVQNSTNAANSKTLMDSVVMINSDLRQGSGVVISSEGYIATNFHVIEGSSMAIIKFNDSSYYSGEIYVVSYDPAKDLAILKISKDNLKPAVIGDSNAVSENDNVTSIGSPSGKFNQVSTGNVNYINSHIISTTAPIHEGSSGGALFNDNGELIGITSMYDTNGNYMSIPVNKLKNMEFKGNMPLAEWSSVETNLLPPEELFYYTDNKTAVISWPYVYGADHYNIYSSNSENGEFIKVKNPVTGNYNWKWGVPYCLKINAQSGSVLYFKVSSVKDDIESQPSDVYAIEFN